MGSKEVGKVTGGCWLRMKEKGSIDWGDLELRQIFDFETEGTYIG